MANRDGTEAPLGRLARELERERHERELHDEARAHLGTADDLRSKDARERDDSNNLKRQHAGR